MNSRRRKRLVGVDWLETRCLLAAAPIISEFLAANDQSVKDEDGEASDWIEVHNPASEPIDLSQWSLTDDAAVPAKWLFPKVTLDAGDYLTVFASGKNRTNPTGTLHTNFRLRAEGEFLGLADSQGQIVQNFGESYSLQSTDVSYGFSMSQRALVRDSTEGRYFVPTESQADAAWNTVDFNASSWKAFSAAIGFDARASYENAGFEKGDLSGWEVRGVAVAVSSTDAPTTQGMFHGFVHNDAAITAVQIERFLGIDRNQLDQVGGADVQTGSALKRQLEVQAGDVLKLDWNFLTDETVIGGSNDFAFVSIGKEVFKLSEAQQPLMTSNVGFVRESGYQTFEYTVKEPGTLVLGVGVVNQDSRAIVSGLLVDNLRVNDGGDAAGLYDSFVKTDIQNELLQVNSSLWMRYEFDVDTIQDINGLVLRGKYDDGFVATLNGQPLIRQNAPDTVGWNSTSVAGRNDELAFEFQDFHIRGGQRLLRAGKNVLAVQGLTESVQDRNGVFEFELIGIGKRSDEAAYLSRPTPGLPNFADNFDFVADVSYSAPHGFYNSPFDVTLSTSTPGAKIRYTIDGSQPTAENGLDYSTPVKVSGSTVIKAVGIKEGLEPSTPATQSYLFVTDAIRQNDQTAIRRGFPASWGAFDPPRWPVKEADYEMDRRIIGPNDAFGGKYAREIEDSLTAIPTLSLVMDVDDLFGDNGIHQDPRREGPEWERPTSVELIYPDGRDGFQIDGGIRIQGGATRFISQKQSLRLVFKDEYGPSKLVFPIFGPGGAEIHDSITLRASTGEYLTNNMHYIRDETARRLQLSTGNQGSRGTFMHLYINGLYWGVFNTVERIDAQFAVNYYGGTKEQYDVLNAGDSGELPVSPLSGTLDAWNALVALTEQMAAASTQAEKTRIYQQIKGLHVDGTGNADFETLLDSQNYIDYLITQVYVRNTDWPIRNYILLRERGANSTGFKFFVWDAEFAFDGGFRREVSSIPADGVGIIYQGLKTSESFLLEFSDRMTEHFSPGGALYVDPANPDWDPAHPERNRPAAVYVKTASEVESALVAESARWGDQTIIYYDGTPLNRVIFTRDEVWKPTIQRNLNTFFNSRSANFLIVSEQDSHYRPAPTFSPDPPGEQSVDVAITGRFAGSIYYTMDDSDPRLPGGSRSPTALAYTSPIRLTSETTIRARSFGGERWSSIATATYLTQALPADTGNLRISELNYNPHAAITALAEADVDNDEFEFVELVNIGSRPIDLSGVSFIATAGQGIAFTFGRQIVAAGAHVVVPKNFAAFLSRYGDGVEMAIGAGADAASWIYQGSLANGGELLTLRDARGRLIQEFVYGDSGLWPGRADGNASSLEVVDMRATYDGPANFRNSSEFGGSPGVSGLGRDNRIVVNEVLSNTEAPRLDQIELMNRSLQTVDVSGWFVSDSNGDYLKFKIPNGSEITPGEFLPLDERQLGFRLNSVSGDDVYLIQSDSRGKPLRFVDHVEFAATAPGVTLGRWPNGSGQLYPQAEPTIGTINSGPRVGDIIVSEVQYDPGDPDGLGELTESSVEYLELYNRSANPVDVSGWRLRGDVEIDLPQSTVIAAGEALVAVAFDPATDIATRTLFQLLFQTDPRIKLIGPFAGSLGNGSGSVRLFKPELVSPEEPDITPYSLVDDVEYDSVIPWPREIGGSNKSINRVNQTAFGNDGRNWQARSESPGRVSFQPPTRGDFDDDRLVSARDLDLLCQAVRTSDGNQRFDLTGDGRVDQNDLNLLFAEILRTGPGDSNLDRVFDSSDLVLAFVAAEYEDSIQDNSGWSDGDWNCDGDFTTRDLVDAFVASLYQTPPAVNSVADRSQVVARMSEADDSRKVDSSNEFQRRSTAVARSTQRHKQEIIDQTDNRNGSANRVSSTESARGTESSIELESGGL